MNSWQSRIDDITGKFKQELTGVSQELLLKSKEGEWSMAQHVSHLIKLNETYFPVFDQIIAGTHKSPGWSWLKPWVNFCGNIIHKAVKPDNHKKTKTFPLWEPDAIASPEVLLEAFQKHQSELSSYFNQLEKRTPEKLIINSPGNKAIIYKLEKAMHIILDHELRHLNHIRLLKKGGVK